MRGRQSDRSRREIEHHVPRERQCSHRERDHRSPGDRRVLLRGQLGQLGRHGMGRKNHRRVLKVPDVLSSLDCHRILGRLGLCCHRNHYEREHRNHYEREHHKKVQRSVHSHRMRSLSHHIHEYGRHSCSQEIRRRGLDRKIVNRIDRVNRKIERERKVLRGLSHLRVLRGLWHRMG